MLNGQFDPMTEFGGSLIQKKGIGRFNGVKFVGEVVPRQATIVAGGGRLRFSDSALSTLPDSSSSSSPVSSSK